MTAKGMIIRLLCWLGWHTKTRGYSERDEFIEWYCLECGKTTHRVRRGQ